MQLLLMTLLHNIIARVVCEPSATLYDGKVHVAELNSGEFAVTVINADN